MTSPLQLLRAGLLAALTALPLLTQAQSLRVSIDTTPLAGVSGFLAFDLLAGSPSTTTNVVSITRFESSGSLGSATSAGGVTGSLATTLNLSSGTFFNELLQGISFTAGITRFDISFSNNYLAGNTPDQFSLFLLDASLLPFGSTDPTGAGALIVMDLVNDPQPQVFGSSFATATLSAVPEPSVALLVLLGGAAVLGLARFRKY